MEDCIFCKINKGELPSKTLYQDEYVHVFMSIDPLTNGHLLVIPTKHFENIMDIDEKYIVESVKIIKKIYPVLKKQLKCDGLTISENNFYGQDIHHFHIHLIPRYRNDNLLFPKDEEHLKSIDEIWKIFNEQ